MIAIQLIDERGNVLQTHDDPRVAEELALIQSDSSVCLRFIDPYGDTYYNALQLPVLASELREQAKVTADVAVRARIAKLADFVDNAIARLPHVYIRFFGE